MNNKIEKFMTANQLAYIIVFSVLGIEVLFFPQFIVKYAAQDSWIFMAAGAVYPFYIVFLCIFLCKKFPDENILKLSKKCFGRFLGSILNMIFLIQFIFCATIRCAQLSNLIRIFITYFLTSGGVISVAVAVTAYTCTRGLQSMARAFNVIFYFILPAFFIPLGALKFGNLSNILPVFDPNIPNPLGGIIISLNAYFGVEIVLLLYPYLRNKKDIKKAGVKGVLISSIIFVWFIFIPIYYLGIDIVPKFLWPVLAATKAIYIPSVKNFTFIFMFYFIVLALTSISINYNAIVLIIRDFLPKIEEKVLCILIAPAIYFISSKYGDVTKVRSIIISTIPIFTIFNTVFASVIAMIILLKKDKANEKE